MSEFTFVALTNQIIESTSQEWMTDWASNDTDDVQPPFFSMIQKAKAAVSRDSNPQNKDLWHAVLKEGETAAYALVEIIHSVPLNQMRLHSVLVRPSLEQSAFVENRDKIDTISWIVSTALVGALELTIKANSSNSLKIWVSFPVTGVFLKNALSQLGEVNIESAGNWITLHIKRN